mgnify:CR=1 FL=1
MSKKPPTMKSVLAADEIKECFDAIQEDIAAGDVEECVVIWVKKSAGNIRWDYICSVPRLVYLLEAVKFQELMED